MESLLHSLETANPLWAYFILFISAFIENIFPPIPGDTVTVFGAYLVGRGLLSFWGVWISTTLGSIAGFMAIFAIAYWIEWKTMVPEIWLLGNPGQPVPFRDKVDNLFGRRSIKNEFITGIPAGTNQLHCLERNFDWPGCGSG